MQTVVHSIMRGIIYSGFEGLNMLNLLKDTYMQKNNLQMFSLSNLRDVDIICYLVIYLWFI
jgi:hypothetical protein